MQTRKAYPQTGCESCNQEITEMTSRQREGARPCMPCREDGHRASQGAWSQGRVR